MAVWRSGLGSSSPLESEELGAYSLGGRMTTGPTSRRTNASGSFAPSPPRVYSPVPVPAPSIPTQPARSLYLPPPPLYTLPTMASRQRSSLSMSSRRPRSHRQAKHKASDLPDLLASHHPPTKSSNRWATRNPVEIPVSTSPTQKYSAQLPQPIGLSVGIARLDTNTSRLACMTRKFAEERQQLEACLNVFSSGLLSVEGRTPTTNPSDGSRHDTIHLNEVDYG
ncbi:unnamed protein product [Protopolystoma xenopodis]|uniref:Uncharacterized protein n=1 Tax=Protopolystoma xenopodis TaxID=117903 RepID=A0A448WEF4_9PLAT|nr:unnamed protein product [Protopolystoma xenopodis]